MRVDFGVGLCGACRWRRTIESGKGSTFHLCERSKIDASLPKYPRLPVWMCHGFEPTTGVGGHGDPGSGETPGAGEGRAAPGEAAEADEA